MTHPLDLTGAAILVTGASSGIGRDVAVLLSSLNATVVIAGRNRERLRQTLASLQGSGHQAESFDLTQIEDIPKWIQSIAEQTGPLLGMVHAAGKQSVVPIRFATEKRMDDLIRSNLYSSIMLARGFSQKSCHAAGGASIVFLSSITALAGRPALSIYSATKAALIGLTKSLALELAPQRIRVNCVAPGFVRTEMLEEVRHLLTEEQMKTLEEAHPLGLGTPRDVAHAVAFLLAATGRWITGSTIVLDGGYSAQ